MTEGQNNVEKVEAFFAAIDRGDLETLFSLHTDPFENHGQKRTRAAIAMVVDDIRTRAPDVHTSIDRVLAAGNEVVTWNTYSGTHLGVGKYPVDGGQLVGVPATGRKFSVAHIHWFTFRDGLICAHRAVRDDVGMLVQLGLLPPPPPFAPPAA